MWPAEVPSDSDVHEIGYEELVQRSYILSDIRSEFQGAAWADAFVAIVLCGSFMTALLFGWAPPRPILSSATVFFVTSACIGIACNSFLWLHWANKRLKTVDLLKKRKLSEGGQ